MFLIEIQAALPGWTQGLFLAQKLPLYPVSSSTSSCRTSATLIRILFSALTQPPSSTYIHTNNHDLTFFCPHTAVEKKLFSVTRLARIGVENPGTIELC